MSTRNVSALTEPLRIGGATGYTEVSTDGSIRHQGAAAIWDDVVQGLNATQLYGTPGKVDYDPSNHWVVMQAGGSLANTADTVFVNFQIPHAAKDGTLFKLHFHWSQTSEVVRTITGRYRIQGNGIATTTAWTDFTATTEYGGTGDNVFDTSAWNYGTGGNYNQITRLVDIDLAGAGLSAMVQVEFTRSDATAGADVYVYSVDGHIEMDAGGSREEYTK